MAKDPYQYFRIEAREHVEGLSTGVLELEKRGVDQELVSRLLRHAHTLKGAARVVRQSKISELSHSIEEILAPSRGGKSATGRDSINALLQLIDSIEKQLNSLTQPLVSTAAAMSATPGGAAQPVTSAGNHPPEGSFNNVRVEINELDLLLHGIWEVGINLSAMRQQATALDQVLIEATERELLQLQDRAGQLRLLPASSLFPSLERAARDAADSTGKQLEFRAVGGDNRLDAHVLRRLNDALLHLVRNAVCHGIESPAERAAASKPMAGRVDVAVERRGNRLTFSCRDDGRGIDVAAVRRVASARGLVSDNEPLTPEEAVRLLFRGGFTTAGAVTEHAGRGIGLDVVRETARLLDGNVEMRSVPSIGTIVQVTVPVSMESMAVLEVEIAGHRTCIPFMAVRRVLHVSDSQIAQSPEGDAILLDGSPVPIVPLAQLYFPKMPLPPRSGARRVIVIETGNECVAVSVDRICGRKMIVLKALPAALDNTELILGACLDALGDPVAVIDPSNLGEAVRRAPGSLSLGTSPCKPCVLVIDDSLTTRMLEQSILETAGYEVDLAVSGEDGLVKAKGRPYSVYIVDVEMPGMSGFEFIAKAKSDPDLTKTPAVLVTSRGAPEDRARGEAVGAAAYIVKGEFQEVTFLKTISRLVA